MERRNRLASLLMQRHRESAFYDIQERKKYTFRNRGLALEKYVGRADVFGSFTELPESPYESRQKIGPKLGINPGTTYNTPIGIYSYPISYLVRLYDESSAEFDVPFAGEANYIHIFTVKDLNKALKFNPDETEVISQIRGEDARPVLSQDQYLDIYKTLLLAKKYVDETIEEFPTDAYEANYKYPKWYPRWLEGLKSSTGIGNLPPTFQDEILFYFRLESLWPYTIYESGTKMKGFKVDLFFNNIINDISSGVAKEKFRFPYEDRLRNLPDIKVLSEEEYQEHKKRALEEDQRIACDTAFVWNFLRLFARNPVKWTALMRQMGFIGAVDDGTGTIHDNEPTQAVFFNPSSIKIIEVMHNEVPKQHSGPSVGTQSLLGQWTENPERGIKGALSFLRTEIDNLNQLKNHFSNGVYDFKDIIIDLYEVLVNIMKYVGWLNLHAKDHPEWSPLKKSQVESSIRKVMEDSLISKEIKDLYERIVRSLRRRS